MTAHRCREHHDQPVTWRGTGCTVCTPPARRRPGRRGRGLNNYDLPAWARNGELDRHDMEGNHHA